jgi:hypothetical protein
MWLSEQQCQGQMLSLQFRLTRVVKAAREGVLREAFT